MRGASAVLGSLGKQTVRDQLEKSVASGGHGSVLRAGVDRLEKSMSAPDRANVIRSGVAAGAAVVALSAASAATSALRRRAEKP
jgi:hypothetical protein